MMIVIIIIIIIISTLPANKPNTMFRTVLVVFKELQYDLNKLLSETLLTFSDQLVSKTNHTAALTGTVASDTIISLEKFPWLPERKASMWSVWTFDTI